MPSLLQYDALQLPLLHWQAGGATHDALHAQQAKQTRSE
jgi:hypothetical protein